MKRSNKVLMIMGFIMTIIGFMSDPTSIILVSVGFILFGLGAFLTFDK